MMTKYEINDICAAAAALVGKNAGVAPELCFPHIYLTFKDALAAIGPAPVAAEVASIDTPLPVQPPELMAYWRCESCDGHGVVGELQSMGHFQPPEAETCGDCGGAGRTLCAAYLPEQLQQAVADALAGQVDDYSLCINAVEQEATKQKQRAAKAEAESAENHRLLLQYKREADALWKRVHESEAELDKEKFRADVAVKAVADMVAPKSALAQVAGGQVPTDAAIINAANAHNVNVHDAIHMFRCLLGDVTPQPAPVVGLVVGHVRGPDGTRSGCWGFEPCNGWEDIGADTPLYATPPAISTSKGAAPGDAP